VHQLVIKRFQHCLMHGVTTKFTGIQFLFTWSWTLDSLSWDGFVTLLEAEVFNLTMSSWRSIIIVLADFNSWNTCRSWSFTIPQLAQHKLVSSLKPCNCSTVLSVTSYTNSANLSYIGFNRSAIIFGRWFIQIKKNKGPSIELWGTPCFILPHSEKNSIVRRAIIY